jgi:hypothetical protein
MRGAVVSGVGLIKVQMSFSLKQHLLRFPAVGIGYAAIDRTNCSALWLLMESHTFCAFVGYYIIDVIGNRCSAVIGLMSPAQAVGEMAPNPSAIGIGPVNPPFIYSMVGTLRLAGPAIDAFISYDNGHR